MKANAFLTLALLLSSPLTLLPRAWQEEGRKPTQEEDEDELSGNAFTRFFLQEGERLAEEVEGTWMLLEYVDPLEPELAANTSGYAMFQDGFLSFMLTVEAWERRIFRLRERLIVLSGLYRYRFDEQAFLQLSSTTSITNQTSDGNMQQEPAGTVVEYYATIEDGTLELRDPDGVVMTFRKVTAGEFPERDIRTLESLRSRTDQWDELEVRPR